MPRAQTQRALLLRHSAFADLKLAKSIRDSYYTSWTQQPKKTINAANALKELHRITGNSHIEAYSNWVEGIAKLTKGELENAILLLDKADEKLTQIGERLEAAQTKVARVYALALLGRYDEAIATGRNARSVFLRNRDLLAAGKIEMNMANIVSRREQHFEAEKLYLSARVKFRRLKEAGWLTMCENGLAITYTALNEFRLAEKFYSSALIGAHRSKMRTTEAEIEASMGTLAMFRARFDEALRLFERSRQKFQKLQMPQNDAVAKLEIADIYLELNLIPEAKRIYFEVLPELEALKLRGASARGYAHLARAKISSGEVTDAKADITKAISLFTAEKNEVGIAEAELVSAGIETNKLEFANALRILSRTKERLIRARNFRLKLLAQQLEAENLMALKKNRRARFLLLRIQSEAKRSHQLATEQTAQVLLGKIAVSAGKFSDAKACFKRAISVAEKLRAPLPAEEFRIAFFSARLAPYIELAKLYLKERKFEKAFELLERSRGRSLVESLVKRSQTIDSGKRETRLSRELAELREELNWFYSRLDRAPSADIPGLEVEARLREKKIEERMRQISATARNTKSREESIDLDLIKRLLGREKLLINFISFEGSISAFAITDKEIRYVENIATEEEIASCLEGLNFQFGALRYGLKPVQAFLPELRKRADFHLQGLYEKLLAPFEDIMAKRGLVIVPVGQLNYVPFHALFDGQQYVVEQRDVNSFPSATVFQHISQRRRRNIKKTLFVANADEKIPLVEREVQTLRKQFQNSAVMKGKQARVNEFLDIAGDYDLLHIACHGQFRADNPLFSSLHLHDGWVTVRDICAQRLKSEIVTLSACETGKNKIFGGEEILGLARGFLSAGARSLVLSLWTVNDEATTNLMTDFYKSLRAGSNAANALRKAQCNFISRGEHPYLWSPFFVIGS